MKQYTQKLGTSGGFSLTETLIAILLTGVITASAYQFFVSMHQQTLSQQQISDMQQTTRVTLDEIGGALKTAGFKIPVGTLPYLIRGESLYVFSSVTQPVDTTLYYLANYSSMELARLDQFPPGSVPRKLMRKSNHGNPTVFADNITRMSYQVLDSVDIKIGLTVVAPRVDQSYRSNHGYRTASDTTQVRVRNYRS